MQTVEETAAKVQRFIATELLSEGGELGPDTQLMDTGVLNSISIVKLLAFLESEFAIKVAPRDVNGANLGSIATIAKFVDARRTKDK